MAVPLPLPHDLQHRRVELLQPPVHHVVGDEDERRSEHEDDVHREAELGEALLVDVVVGEQAEGEEEGAWRRRGGGGGRWGRE